MMINLLSNSLIIIVMIRMRRNFQGIIFKTVLLKTTKIN